MMYYVNSVWTAPQYYEGYTNGYATTQIDSSMLIGSRYQVSSQEAVESVSMDDLLKLVEDPKSKIKLPNFPHCNIYTIDDTAELVLELAVAGYSKDRLSVQISRSNVLSIKGTKESKDTKKTTVIQQGITNKEFDMSLQFDQIYDLEKAVVEVDNGILSVKIPRTTEHKVKKLL